jgi:hypothetical protein
MLVLNGIPQKATRFVVGNRGDSVAVPYPGADDTSIMAYTVTGYQHVHQSAKVYPTLANAVTVTSASGSWAALGTPTEVIPANTITKAFDLHWLILSDISSVAQYELVVYGGPGGSETEIARASFSRSANFAQEGNVPIQIPQQAGNTRISAALSDSTAGTESVGVKFYYHQYGA